jgi:co-chaperonin GroES (HSP10)
MRVFGNNVLVTQAEAETTTAGGIILQNDISSGNKPAVVISYGNGERVTEMQLVVENKVFLDWSKAMPVELDGLKCAVIDCEHIKLIIE